MSVLSLRLVALLLLILCGETAFAAAEPSKTTFAARTDALRADIVRDPAAAMPKIADLRHSAEAIADPAQEAVAVATVDRLQGEALLRLDRVSEARTVIDRAIARMHTAAPASKLYGDLLIAHGGAAAASGDIQAALHDYQLAYGVYGRAGEARGQAIALQDIGSMYRDAGDYRNALRYNANALEIFSSDPALRLSAYNNRGNALTELHRYADAEAEYQRALAVAEQQKSPLLVVRILQNIARAQVWAGQLHEANATLARAFALAASGPAMAWRPGLNGVAAMAALRAGKLDDAATLIDRTFDGASKAQAAMPMRDFHLTAYQIFRQRHEAAKALIHLEAFKQLDDQSRILAASTNAALMGARFDFANQNLKIAQRDAAIDSARVRLREIVTGGLLVAAAVITTLLTIGFISLARSRNQVRAANATLKVTNDELERALAAKTEFLATTSHEIRTPLNGILGMTQVILAERTISADLKERIGLIHGAGETMRALVDDILDVAKMETGELRIHPGDMDLTRLLRNAATVWAGQAETKAIGITLDLGDCPGGIVADEVRLRQIVFNLMSNAIKFTDRGQVRLIAAARPGDRGERLIIRIEDSGIGIPPDRLGEIFESFRQVDGGTTRRHGGTGLGLAICRSLARAMGGDVTVSSVLGAGSTFTLELPLVRAHMPAYAARQPTAMALGEAAMLLIEANPLSQGIMRAVLGPHVRSLRIAGDIDTGLGILADGDVDHVVADGGALGFDMDRVAKLTAAARAAVARDTLLWPSPDPAIADALKESGVTQLLSKPISAPDLLAALQMVYDQSIASCDMAA